MNDNWTQFYSNCNKQILTQELSPNTAYCVERYLDKTVVNWEGKENYINIKNKELKKKKNWLTSVKAYGFNIKRIKKKRIFVTLGWLGR